MGLLIAAAGIGLHQLTGRHEFDAAGSIVDRAAAGRRRDLPDAAQHGLPARRGPRAGGPQRRCCSSILEHPDIERVTYLHLEFVGPQRLFVVAAVDLTGDDREPDLAVRLRKVETDIERNDLIEDAVLTLSLPTDPSLTPR